MYIQIVLPYNRYECLWSAQFRDHDQITPVLFKKLVDQSGWTKQAITSLKETVAIGCDPLTTFSGLDLDLVIATPADEPGMFAEDEAGE